MEVPEPHGTIVTACHLQMKEKGEIRTAKDESCGGARGVRKEDNIDGKKDNTYHKKW